MTPRGYLRKQFDTTEFNIVMSKHNRSRACRVKKGSSLNSGEGLADFEEEVFIVAVSVGYSFCDYNLVVDAFL